MAGMGRAGRAQCRNHLDMYKLIARARYRAVEMGDLRLAIHDSRLRASMKLRAKESREMEQGFKTTR